LEKNKGHIQSVGKALMILDLLGANHKEMSLGEITKKLGFSKPTAHSLLSTLRTFGYVKHFSSDGSYWLGVRLFELGSCVLDGWDFRKAAIPFIEELMQELQETVQLAVLDGGEVLYVEKRESHQSLRVVSDIGKRLPVHCTGLGKCLLAFSSPGEIQKIILVKGLPRYTSNTITDPDLLNKELEKIKSQGYAIDNEEIMEGLRCVAAPIMNIKGEVVAAISISGPVGRLKDEQIEFAKRHVVETAQQISAFLSS